VHKDRDQNRESAPGVVAYWFAWATFSPRHPVYGGHTQGKQIRENGTNEEQRHCPSSDDFSSLKATPRSRCRCAGSLSAKVSRPHSKATTKPRLPSGYGGNSSLFST